MKFYFKYICQFFCLSALLFCLTSCFTGIESTKKITLSREDKRLIKPTDEDLFLRDIKGLSLGEWDEGHQFLVTDNKAILIFEPHGFPLDKELPQLEGDTLIFSGVESRLDAAGNVNAVINFANKEYRFPYNTGKSFENALTSVKSDQIPMLIDLKLVENARAFLTGQKLWTRTLLWYDDKGERINGKKFAPVTITDVQPGNMVFPLRVKIEEDNKNGGWLLMNAGNSGTESRSFSILFSLTDPKKHFSSISDENWDLICRGEISKGMTKEECRLSLGNPIEINSGHDYSQTLDIWTYENGIVLWFEDGLLSRYRK